MSQRRIKACFARLHPRKALIPCILASDPPGKTVELMHRLVVSSADMNEPRFALPDPVANDPAVVRVHERVVSHDVTLYDVFTMVSQFRTQDATTPNCIDGVSQSAGKCGLYPMDFMLLRGGNCWPI